MGSGNSRDISYICLQQDILVTSQGIISPVSFFFVLGGGPWLEGRCLETKRILAYAEFCSGKTIYLEQNDSGQGATG